MITIAELIGNYFSTPLYAAIRRYTPLPIFYAENLINLSKNLYLSVFGLKTLKSGSKISKVVEILIILGIENVKFT